MDPFHSTKFLLVISQLLLRCLAQQPKYGEKCYGTKPCDSKLNLSCDYTTYTCICHPPYVHVGNSPGCVWPKAFGEPCDKVPCKEELACKNEICGCSDPAHVFDGTKCRPRRYLDPCNPPPPEECDKTQHMTCQARRCLCEPGWTWIQTRCIKESVHGEPCGASQPCRTSNSFNLACDPATSKCICSPPDLVPNSAGACVRKAKYNEPCGPPACDEVKNLVCPTTPSPKCVCKDDYGNVPTTDGCYPYSQLGDDCSRMFCHPKGNFRCSLQFVCECAGGFVPLPPPSRLCGNPAGYGEDCTVNSCKENSNLTCGENPKKCICATDHVPNKANQCVPRAKFGEECDRPECDSRLNLTCVAQGSTKKCACTPGNIKWPNLACGPPAKLGESCVDRACDPKGYLNCWLKNKMCICKVGYVEHPGGICGDPSVFGERCGPPICKANFELTCKAGLCSCTRRWMDHVPGVGNCVDRPKSILDRYCELNEDCAPTFNLECKGKKCICVKFYEPDPRSRDRCRRIPSLYREECKEDSHCLQNQNMYCETNGNYCDCLPSHDLDDLGGTPCVFNHFNGKTYGQPCEASPQVRRCLTSHNLTCIAGKCVCIDKHVPNDKTVQNPAYGAVTCKIGGGTQNHGDKCEPNGNTIYQRCDDLLNLDCSLDYKVCACAPGFIPTGDKDNPCDGGKQPHGAYCDPPEVIIPPKGIDPITGLPIPGPTSPPPPKLACDPSLQLVCNKDQKCTCPEEGVTKKYQLETESGKCFLTAGYACKVHADVSVESACQKRRQESQQSLMATTRQFVPANAEQAAAPSPGPHTSSSSLCSLSNSSISTKLSNSRRKIKPYKIML